MSDIPTISITQENTQSNDDTDGDYEDAGNISDALTDIENFDSHDEDGDRNRPFTGVKKFHKKAAKKPIPDQYVTDIEDYADSGSEEDKSEVPETKFSLEEFLDHGFTDEATQVAEQLTSKTGNRTLRGKFLDALPIDDPGCITDCENLDTSNEESDHDDEKSIVLEDVIGNFPEDPGTIHISDKLIKKLRKLRKSKKTKKSTPEKSKPIEVNDEAEQSDAYFSEAGFSDGEVSEAEVSVADDVSQAEGGENSQVEGVNGAAPLSEEEVCFIDDSLPSDSEDEFNQACGGENDNLAIDITFIHGGKTCHRHESLAKSSPFKGAPNEIVPENLTDVEKLGSSTDEDDSNDDMPIPSACVSIYTEGECTDIEDLDLGDLRDLITEAQQVSHASIPSATREITIVKVDKSGGPVASVMPLEDGIHLDILGTSIDKGLTDVEEVSGAEEDYIETFQVTNDHVPEIDNAVVRNSECIRIPDKKRSSDTNEIEPVTDVEEIFMAGTVRRKKPKSKSQAKAKKLLDPRQAALAGAEIVLTDVEEVVISDVEQNEKPINKQLLATLRVADASSADAKTDVEYVTGEEDGSVSDGDPKSDTSILTKENYCSVVTSIETLSREETKIRKKTPSPEIIAQLDERNSAECPTDVEDVQVQSDVEGATFSYSRANTVSPSELQSVLNEGSMSVIYEKCGRSFNIDKERNHIKGLTDFIETHTDIESLDEEQDKDENLNASKEGK